MLHYLALLWNDGDPERAATARDLLRRFCAERPAWQILVDQKGLAVCCSARRHSRLDELHVLPGGRGVVLGKLFDRSYADRADTHEHEPAPVVLDARRAASIVAGAGQDLIERYWGHYVAFLEDPASRRRWVLRDPSGGVPCQWTSILGVDVYFVRLEDCERLGPLALSINRHFFLGYLLYSSSCVRQTPLNEVQTVLPGERIEHRYQSRTHDFAWNPLDVAKRNVIEDEVEAVRVTRRTVRGCVHAWASCFDGILHSLSGGLDSSIVLSCLADAPTAPRILCRNFYLAGPNSDERVFARLSARRAGAELIEREAKTDFGNQSAHYTVRSLFPFGWPVDIEHERAEREFLRSHGLSADFKGHGGDEIFFRGGSFPTAVDYAWRCGLRPPLLSIAFDDAALNQASVWSVLRWVYRYGVRQHPWHMRQSVPFSHMPLMAASLRKEARRDLTLWHPLYRDAADLPPGKFEHAYLLTYGTGKSHDPLRAADDAASVSPLMSQPLIELSLRTPLYVLRAGGRDRAIVRRAFAADVPAEIISRKSKAYGTHQYRLIIARNIDVVRELLLEGFLVREGFLDRPTLEQTLSGHVSRVQGGGITELCSYLSVEAWARSWTQAHRAVSSRADARSV